MKKFALCLFFVFNCHAHVSDLMRATGQAYWDNCRALGFKSSATRSACLSASGNLISSSATALAFAFDVNPTDYIKHYHLDAMTAWDMHRHILLYLAAHPNNRQGSLSTVSMDVLFTNWDVQWSEK